ncbi:hypothetical protein NQ314_010265 [Rhamnusium bicolor]|uniref:Uncharacterized protein n=1 Tax=Rhamnusium bicolor TaxID=1586634 RepID=A0AAV8XTE6_9CUCU|nr:hypothetical protein NQ314_010265 [Rhamnusium bicolor]
MLNIVVYVLRFCRVLPINFAIMSTDLEQAEEYLIKLVQARHFSENISLLENNEQCSFPIRKLRPFLKDGVLRVGGRLRNSQLDFNQQHPILLPKTDHFVNILIDHYHRRNLHTGPTLVLALLR